MHDLRFYENVRDLTVGELAEFVSGRLDGNSSGLIVTIHPTCGHATGEERAASMQSYNTVMD